MSSAIDPTNVFDPLGTVRQQGSLAGTTPAQNSTTTPFFPAVCLSTHWDPTRIYARTVPTQLVSLPLDFRPYI